MNALDRVIGYFNPERALKREYARYKMSLVQNSGYGNYGASRSKKSLKGWVGTGGSAYEDIHDNLATLRTRSRDLTMGVPLASGAIKTYRTNVIGSGLTPKPTIDSGATGLTEEQAGEMEKQISREFNLWADSVNCDAERLATFYELQQLSFQNWLMSGDCFAILQMKNRIGSVYELCIQLIEADRVSTPGNDIGIDTGTKIVGGVEVDSTGEVVAYHVAKHHPLSYRNDEHDWVRVEAFGKASGRRNILHVMTRERIGQRRGVPILAPVIESLKQLGRYTDAELVAAVVNGFMSVFIQKKEQSTAPPFGELSEPQDALVDAGDPNSVELAPGAIIDLAPGEEANPVTPGRPNANFDAFVTAITRQIGAALELPPEILVKQFSANYSASRAALLEAWKSFSMWRDWMVEKFCQPVYEEWLSEAVAKGRVSAPGFFSDPAIRQAYSAAQWYGPTQGQLDPVKEVEAAQKRIENCFSTHAKEAMELTGTDFMDNVRAIRQERKLMQDSETTNNNHDGKKEGEKDGKIQTERPDREQ
ncbi:MAG: phage portal protein [Eubacteriales bacterium]|nr:phage portal protein [Eubacteriales bacterium]